VLYSLIIKSLTVAWTSYEIFGVISTEDLISPMLTTRPLDSNFLALLLNYRILVSVSAIILMSIEKSLRSAS
jgi:hypothetical protein